jgi:release factor glutamine methyltransferase
MSSSMPLPPRIRPPFWRSSPDLAGDTVSTALDRAAQRLTHAGIDRPRFEARLLLTHSAGLSQARQIADPDHVLGEDVETQFEELIARRENHEPMSHLTGEREFWSLPFGVSSAVLDPRPDSETLVAAALENFPDPGGACSILDLGTGSGCLLLSVLKNRLAARGIGVDVSPEALRIAVKNADRLDLSRRAGFVCGDWGTAVDGSFDLILCNPPYISTGELANLAPEVARYEPWSALDGGADGLAAYRDLLPQLSRLLRADGVALVEIGAGQTADVAAIAKIFGLRVSHIYRDLAGIQRCLAFTCCAAFTVT